ncbi:hypothetical protein FRB97_001257 [Tulasnella sp. 331]|nr:hypothetical protein FRB97_001257 [Tulasnella sp. 331]
MNSTKSLSPAALAALAKADSPFGFIPTLSVCILFVCLFALTTAAHLFQTIRYRTWWWFTLVTCGFVECIGWAGRVWGSQNPWIMSPYLMQICCTIFAPSFMTAAMFIIFVKIVIQIGPEYSRLTPKAYTYLFVGVDFVALVIQAIGGGQAATAATPQGSQNGAHVMVGGIIIQMAAVAVYALVSIEYVWRVLTDRPIRAVQDADSAPTLEGNGAAEGFVAVYAAGEKSKTSLPVPLNGGRAGLTYNVKLMVLGLAIATVLVIIRSIYRTIETLFDCLDGVPIFLAMLSLNVFHPGRLIPNARAMKRATSA